MRSAQISQESHIQLPWGAWYKDRYLRFTFPDEWNVRIFAMRDAPRISDEEIEKAFAKPIGTKPLRELATVRKSAVIVVDDISRPTRLDRILPFLIGELEEGGITEEQMSILVALGAHRPMTRQDFIRKMGKRIITHIPVHNHNPYEDLVDLGIHSGTPVKINARFMKGELKIGVGCITPNICGGFGGGAKIILPGIASMETIEANHRSVFTSGKCASVGTIDKTRLQMEEVAKKAGLDAIVNVVVNSNRETAGVFVGDPIEAHRQGMEFAKKVYATEVPSQVDIAVFNAYPEDTELLQANKAFYPYISTTSEIVEKGGVLVLSTASSEGKGYHSLLDEGMKLFSPFGHSKLYSRIIDGKSLVIFSPNVSISDIRNLYPQALLARRQNELIKVLKTFCRKKSVTVAVFPSASIQIAAMKAI